MDWAALTMVLLICASSRPFSGLLASAQLNLMQFQVSGVLGGRFTCPSAGVTNELFYAAL